MTGKKRSGLIEEVFNNYWDEGQDYDLFRNWDPEEALNIEDEVRTKLKENGWVYKQLMPLDVLLSPEKLSKEEDYMSLFKDYNRFLILDFYISKNMEEGWVALYVKE